MLINTQIASHLAPGSVSWLTYADRLMEFPTAMLGVALGVVLMLLGGLGAIGAVLGDVYFERAVIGPSSSVSIMVAPSMKRPLPRGTM